MRVYEGRIHCPRRLIFNLDDIGKSSEVIGLHNEFESYVDFIVGAIERPLCGRDRFVLGDRRIYVRGASLRKLTWLTNPL